MNGVKYWVGYDDNGELTTINEAKGGTKYRCVDCNGVLIPNKGKIKAYHFAHQGESPCSGETHKHKFVVKTVYDLLQQDEWLLEGCEIHHEKYVTINGTKFKPDVHIRWRDGRTILAIEIKNTSKSSEIKKDYFGKNLIEFDIEHWGDEELSNPIFILNNIYPRLFRRVNQLLKKNLENIEFKVKALKEQQYHTKYQLRRVWEEEDWEDLI